jgi:hypothetical protein
MSNRTSPITVVAVNGNNQSTVRISRSAWNRASDGAAVPFGRPGCAPVVVGAPDDPNGVHVHLSAAATDALRGGIITTAASVAASAVRAASPDGMGGHAGRVYDGDIVAVVADDDDDVTTAAGRAAARRRRGMRRPAVGR